MGGRWDAPPPGLALGSAEVHVWRARLDVAPDQARALEPNLAPAERERAARFRRPADRDRFVVAHAALRAILAGYLSLEPRAIRLTTDRRGKPRLPDTEPLGFNLSHSADLALCALARDCEIGIDLERVDPTLPATSIAERFFTPDDTAALRALPPDAQRRAFFDLWVRKEAYRKARGDGLTLALDTPEAPGWTVTSLDVEDGYTAALAHAGPYRPVTCWEWPGP